MSLAPAIQATVGVAAHVTGWDEARGAWRILSTAR